MRLSRTQRFGLLWLVPGLCLAWTALTSTDSATPASARSSFAERFLGPIAGLASTVQWVRVDEALRAGNTAEAYQIASSAIELSPSAPAGWIYLAHHFVYERGAILAEPDRAARALWIRAGLALLERGERECVRPGPIAFKMGVVFLSLAGLADEDRAWPATAKEAWTLAASAFERARLAGEPGAEAGRDLCIHEGEKLPP